MFAYAKNGNKFVLTEKGANKKRSLGQNYNTGDIVSENHRNYVYRSWLEKEYVIEVEDN